MRDRSEFRLGCAKFLNSLVLLAVLLWAGLLLPGNVGAEGPIAASGDQQEPSTPPSAENGEPMPGEQREDLYLDPRWQDFYARFRDEELDQPRDHRDRDTLSRELHDRSAPEPDSPPRFEYPREDEPTSVGRATADGDGAIEGFLAGEDGAIIRGAWVNLYDENGDRLAGRRVDENGFFSFSGLPAGKYRMWIDPDADYLQRVYPDRDCVRYCRVEDGDPIVLGDDETKQLDITLTRGLSLSVNVFDRDQPDFPIEQMCFDLFTADGERVSWRCRNDAGGSFVLPAVLPGDYKLLTVPFGAFDSYVRTIYPDVACGFRCRVVEQGDIIQVSQDDIDSGELFELNVGLVEGGVLTGSLEDGDGEKLDGWIELLGSNGQWGFGSSRIEGGEFSIKGMASGTYKAVFRSEGFIDQLYKGIPCPDFNCDREFDGQTFQIEQGESKELETVIMEPGATLEGQLTGSDGSVVESAWVDLYDAFGNRLTARRVNDEDDGFFRFTGLVEGQYRLWINPDADYLPRLYANRDCSGFCPREEGDPIFLVEGESKTIDIELTRGLSLSVNLFDLNAPDLSIEQACLDLFTVEGEFVRGRCMNDASGSFRLPAVLPGEYKFLVIPVGTFDNYVRTLYPDVACGFRCRVAEQGEIIQISQDDIDSGQPFELDVGLLEGGVLTGSLEDGDGEKLDGWVELLGSNGQWGFGRGRIEGGQFSIKGMASGTYKAVFRSEGFIDQLYKGIACPDSNCDREILGQTFNIQQGELTELETVTMVPGATLEGQLTGSDGNVVERAWVNLYDPVGNWVASRRVEDDGFYRFTGMVAGEYRMWIDPDADYLPRLYATRDCTGFCPREEGDPIFLEEGESKTIDVELTRGLNITVKAFDRDDPGVPVQTACVELYNLDGQRLTGRCWSNAEGVFRLPPVLPGSYKVEINPYGQSIRYARTLYDGAGGITCLPSCDIANQGAVVEMVDSDRELSIPIRAVDLVSGTVTNAAGEPLREMWVYARPVDNSDQRLYLGWVGDQDGSFTLRVPEGEFYFEFRPWRQGFSKRYLETVYPSVPCTVFGCDLTEAESFDVAGNDIEVNPVLQLGARVTGSVAPAGSTDPVSSVVRIFTADRSLSSGRVTSEGLYQFPAVPPGDYLMAAESRETDPVLLNQLFEAINCTSASIWTCIEEQDGDVLTLQAGDDLQIDFALDPAPTETVTGTVIERNTGIPLAGARVDVIWNDFRQTFRSVQTDASGQFSVDLPAGDFSLIIQQDGYITRMFDSFFSPQAWCPASRCLDYPGQRFTVANEPKNLGDLPMDPGALVIGTVSLPEGAPVDPFHNVTARVFDEDGQPVNSLRIRVMPWFAEDPAGTFALEVPPGTWRVLFEPSTTQRALVPTALGDLPCPNGSCGMESTVSIEVNQGDVVTPEEQSSLSVTLSEGVPLMGTLLDGDNDGAPLEWGGVYIYNEEGVLAGSAFTFSSQDGIFETRYGLPDGMYFASTRFITPQGSSGSGVPGGFVDLLFDGFPCTGACDVTEGTPIEVELEAESLPPAIEFELFRGLTISGSVVRADDGSPVPAQIQVFDGGGDSVQSTLASQEDGTFTVSGLLPGDYYLRTRNFAGLEDQLWAGAAPIACAPSCPPLNGTPVRVDSGSSVEGIDFQLVGAGSISGTTKGSDDAPLESISVEVYNALGGLVASTLSDEAGAWEVDGLPAGEFYVRTRNTLGLVNVAWDGQECTGCDVTQTTVIALDPGGTADDIDLVLDTGATLAGTVTRLVDNSAVAGVNVDVYSASGALLASAQTGSNGGWQIDGLGEGSYRVATRSSIGLVNQVHDGVDCVAGCDISAGSLVELAIGQSATIDFALESAGGVGGSVRDVDDAPIADVVVQAFDADGRLRRQSTTGADGSYQIRGLAPGDVFLRTRADGNYTDQSYDGRDCIPVCDVTGSDPVTVSAGGTIEGIDFTLTFGGGLAGSVSRVDEGSVSSLNVEIYNAVGSMIGSSRTNASGDFIFRGLPGGRYFARTRNTRGQIDQVFDGFGCTPFPCPTGLGTPLELEGGLIEGVDFILSPGSELDGIVTDQFGNALPTGQVVLFDERGRELLRGPVIDGEWRLTGIADGEYFAVVLNGSGLIDELYNRQPCEGARCDVTEGTPIIVDAADDGEARAAQRSEGGRAVRRAADGPLTFELQRGSRIRGQVQAPDASQLANVTVYFFNDAGDVIGSARTDALGEFVSESAFSEGRYYVATTDGETRGVTSGGFVNVVYGDPDPVECALECDATEGTPVELDGQFDGESIIVRVLDGGGLAGSAVDGNDTGLVGAQIEVFDSEGRLSGTASVGSSGNWRVDGLPDGSYTVVVRNDLVASFGDYIVGFGFCSDACDPAKGSEFVIRDGEPESEVKVRLEREDVIFQSRFQADET